MGLVGYNPTTYYPLWINPIYGQITSVSGLRVNPITNRIEFHDGIDIAAPIGTKVVAPKAGTVLAIGFSPSFGRFLRIGHDNEYVSFFAHLNSINVRVGDEVYQGKHVAYSGNTGWSTGPHLHFGIFRGGQFVDPINYVNMEIRPW